MGPGTSMGSFVPGPLATVMVILTAAASAVARKARAPRSSAPAGPAPATTTPPPSITVSATVRTSRRLATAGHLAAAAVGPLAVVDLHRPPARPLGHGGVLGE